MTDFTFISSADNEKIKLYKRLSADKKLRRKEQLFTVEGARLTADAAAEAIELHCVCRMPKSDNAAQYAEMKSGGKYIILDNIQDPGNMGTMLRTADACGIDAIITCNCCDVYNPKTVRSAMGSLMRVNIIDDDIGNAVLNLKNAGIAVYAAVIDSSAVSLTECDFSKGGAVMIGNEGNGLPREHSALADVPLTIKMHGTINSLNAAMAAGIIMWELSKA